MQCVATSAVGTGCNLKLLQELPSKNYDDGECVNVTFFVLVMALPSPSNRSNLFPTFPSAQVSLSDSLDAKSEPISAANRSNRTIEDRFSRAHALALRALVSHHIHYKDLCNLACRED